MALGSIDEVDEMLVSTISRTIFLIFALGFPAPAGANQAADKPKLREEATVYVYSDDITLTIDCDQCGWSDVDPRRTHRGALLPPGPYEFVFKSLEFERTETLDLAADASYALEVDSFENHIETFVSNNQCIEKKVDLSIGEPDARENEARAKQDAPKDTLPEIVHYQPVEYPKRLKGWSIEGKVLVSGLVQPNGRVSDACIWKSDHPMLDTLALTAALDCTFKPGLQKGKPVPVWVIIPYEFSTE